MSFFLNQGENDEAQLTARFGALGAAGPAVDVDATSMDQGVIRILSILRACQKLCCRQRGAGWLGETTHSELAKGEWHQARFLVPTNLDENCAELTELAGHGSHQEAIVLGVGETVNNVSNGQGKEGGQVGGLLCHEDASLGGVNDLRVDDNSIFIVVGSGNNASQFCVSQSSVMAVSEGLHALPGNKPARRLARERRDAGAVDIDAINFLVIETTGRRGSNGRVVILLAVQTTGGRNGRVVADAAAGTRAAIVAEARRGVGIGAADGTNSTIARILVAVQAMGGLGNGGAKVKLAPVRLGVKITARLRREVGDEAISRSSRGGTLGVLGRGSKRSIRRCGGSKGRDPRRLEVVGEALTIITTDVVGRERCASIARLVGGHKGRLTTKAVVPRGQRSTTGAAKGIQTTSAGHEGSSRRRRAAVDQDRVGPTGGASRRSISKGRTGVLRVIGRGGIA